MKERMHESLWNYRPDLSISEGFFLNRIIWCPNVDFQGSISVLYASHSCTFIQCVLLAMFRVMHAEFGDWLSIRVEWFCRSQHEMFLEELRRWRWRWRQASHPNDNRPPALSTDKN